MNFEVEKLKLKDLPNGNKLINAYLNNEESVTKLFKYKAEIDEFEKIIEDKKKDKTDRKLLVEVLQKQYQTIETTNIVKQNIELLKNENTFTVCTAHQLNILTGPLYVIYKIVSAIKLAKILKEKFSDYNFVPVYFLGSEDHDFEEINHLHIYNKKVAWSSSEIGSTGKFGLKGFENVIKNVQEIIGENENVDSLLKDWNVFVSKSKTLGEFMLNVVNQLFKNYGLVVLEADNKKLKQSFSNIIKKEIVEQASNQAIKNELNFLNENYKVQAMPRTINLFFVDENGRNRIDFEDGKYKIVSTKKQFTESEIIDELKNNPEKFSPNVILRPVYQEFILPNLTYIGGSGEISYWLQLKNAFQNYKVNFPMLIIRDSAVFLTEKEANKWNGFGFKVDDFFKDNDILNKQFVTGKNNVGINFDITMLHNIKKQYLDKAKEIDKDLFQPIEGEFKKIEKGLQNLNGKFLRALKRKSEVEINGIAKVKSKVFPQGKLQERYLNFLMFYALYGNKFFEILLENFNPLNNEIKFFISKN